MEYSWKIEHIDETSNTMSVRYLFNTSYPMDPILVNMVRCPAGVNITDHVKLHVPSTALQAGAKFNNSAVAGVTGLDSIYVENAVKLDSLTLAAYKQLKIEELASARFNYEVSGLVIGGNKIDTSRSSQAILTAAYISLKNNLITSVDWKNQSGTFVTLGLAEIEALSTAVSQFVQAAFTKEKDLNLLVNAATTKSEVDAIVW
jgi:hypothetical protein